MASGFVGRIVPRVGIVVPSSAPAPVHALDCQLLFWGNIVNRNDIADRLALSRAGPENDCALLARAFRQWGERLPYQVLGEYALVIYDRRADQAFLTHDSLGLVSLYYSKPDKVADRANGLAFATHLIDLLDEQTTARIDEEYLADFLGCGCITTARTPFPAIRRLLPGLSISLTDGHIQETRHWSLADVAPVVVANQAEYESRFRALLEAAVRGAVDGARTVWTELSGGLDSSTVASIAGGLEVPGLAAWSGFCPSFPQADERKWMREVVNLYRMPWHLTNLEQTLPFSAPPADFIGEPAISAIYGAPRHATNALFAEHGVEVVLSGHGGDAVLGAFPGPEIVEPADLAFRLDLVGAARSIGQWRQGSRERRSYTHLLQYSLLLPTWQHLRGQGITSGPRLPLQPWLDPEYATRMRLNWRRRLRYAERCRTPARQQLADSLRVVALEMARDRQRRRSCWVHSPLMYRPLVEFMSAVPFEQKMRPRCDRYLQRRALKGILPESIRRRAGKGVGTPTFIEGLSRSPEWVDYLTRNSRLAAHGIADAGKWRLAVEQAAVGQTHGDQFFHAGVAVEVWLRQLENHRGAKRASAAELSPHPLEVVGFCAPGDGPRLRLPSGVRAVDPL